MWLYWIRGWKKVFPMKYHLEFDREAVISKYLLTEVKAVLLFCNLSAIISEITSPIVGIFLQR